jgi:hypothetical protein
MSFTRLLAIPCIAFLSASALGSCGSDTETGNTIGSGNAAGVAGKGGSGGSAGTIGFDAAGGTSGSGTVGAGGVGDSGICAADHVTAEAVPVDIFIMLDQSTSMTKEIPGGGNIWNALTGAINQFVQSPAAAGIGVGIQYFGLGIAPASCDVAQYANPEVPIAPLPGVAGAITASLAAHQPSSFTPTGPALEGALQYASGWAAAHPDRQTIVLLATDGYATECDPQSPSGLGALAAAALAQTPKVYTFVIGIGSLGNLNQVAVAGGTREAFIIPDTAQDVSGQIVDALLGIAAAPISCNLPIPVSNDGGTADPDFVNIEFTPPGRPTRKLVRVTDAAACATTPDGWYYDHPFTPTTIIICPQTCQTFGAGTLEILLGCETVSGPT